MDADVKFLIKASAVSRLLIFIMQMIFNFIPDHDADAFKSNDVDNIGFVDEMVTNVFDGFRKWDAKYFLHVAEYGYEEEKMFAFFPLFPALLRMSATLLSFPPLSKQACLLISGTILNTGFFIGATIALYQLTLKIYQNKKFSVLCGIMFCFNPASVFFSSNYTEALYAFCVFNGLYYLEHRSYSKSTLFLACASATRSNGTVNAGFVVYFTIREIIFLFFYSNKNDKIWFLIKYALKISIRTIIMCCFIFLPFVAFNMYGYYKFCDTKNENVHDWCDAKIPILYSHVQSYHWDVGFLRYYKFRKIPNFFLALPCTVLLFHGISNYLKINKHQIKHLGLLAHHNTSKIPGKYTLQFTNCDVFVYVFHSLFLIIFGLCFMHVEVLTRFLFSSSPIPIWVASSFIYHDLRNKDITTWRSISIEDLSLMSKTVILYFLFYTIVGTLLHVNFLPWT